MEPSSSPSSRKENESTSPRPSLLPPFDPTPVSPRLLRPSSKRKFEESSCNQTTDHKSYPTPIPTSSTGVLSSSPPQVSKTRPGLQRTVSTVSERVPLGDVASLELPVNGDPLLLGRSSNSSQYQLSASRLISRVHVEATYQPPTEQHRRGRVYVVCKGWNGLKIHCRGRVHELGKGDSFSSDSPQTDIMVDVQDARVMIRWPPLLPPYKTSLPDPFWEETRTPTRTSTPRPDEIPSSPPVGGIHLQSPITPSRLARSDPTASSTFLGLPAGNGLNGSPVKIFEDQASGEDGTPIPQDSPSKKSQDGNAVQDPSQNDSSPLSSPKELSDHDEENDPIIHSFGPFGDNLLPRMASINATTPERLREPLRASEIPRQQQEEPRIRASPRPARQPSLYDSKINLSPIRNHVINQLAFSRLHSVPINTIMSNLPNGLKQGAFTGDHHLNTNHTMEHNESGNDLTHDHLRRLLKDTPCVGEIAREGKDAAGKALEDEYYYVAEMDGDKMRKEAVESSHGKPGLRAVRKQHKVRTVPCTFISLLPNLHSFEHLRKHVMNSFLM